MKRAAAVGATAIGLVLGAAPAASGAGADSGNYGPIWESLAHEGGTLSAGDWGPFVRDAAPEYVNPSLGGGPGISPGVHLDKDNGPENTGP